jgi:hypothetical protein
MIIRATVEIAQMTITRNMEWSVLTWSISNGFHGLPPVLCV